MLESITQRLAEFRSKPALSIDGIDYSYEQLDFRSRNIAARLEGSVVAILDGRDFDTYAAVVASIRSGRTYIPLDVDMPVGRLQQNIRLSAPEAIVVTPSTIAIAGPLLDLVETTLTVVHPASLDMSRNDRHNYISWTDGHAPTANTVDQTTDNDLYQMLTSGTTGAPKRIAISRQNVASYLAEMTTAFDFRHTDRFSQFFKLTFDLSVHDMLVAWGAGGCLFVPTKRQLLDPVSFARSANLTVWFSVPSLVRLAMMTRKVTPNSLPQIRHALFCGEALPWEVANSFGQAAPTAELTNLYGPTEATIAITRYHIGKQSPCVAVSDLPSVPIGTPFGGHEAVVVGDDLRQVPKGEIGELLLGGPQLAAGYCGDPTETSARFLKMSFDSVASQRWYRTGDLVRFVDDDIVFVGRDDTQIKFRGHRIELGEIEAVLSEVAGSPLAVVMPKSQATDGPIDRLVALIASPRGTPDAIRKKLRERLPSYMQPTELVTIPPDMKWRNANGKVDRASIGRWYQNRHGDAAYGG